MVARENQALATLHLSGSLIDLLVDRHKDEAADEVEDGILGQNILPHIGNAVLVLKGRIARSGSDSMSVAHVEGQEEGRITGQPRGHIDLFQVHRKVYEGTGLEQEQARLRAPFSAELVDCILIGLTGSVTLELEGDDGEAIQENDHVDALFITGPDFLHHGEDVLTILLGQLRIEGGRGLGIHELQLPVGDFNAVLQHLNEAATGFGGLRIDEADDGVLQVGLIDFPQILHRVRLRGIQELEEHLPVNRKQAVVIAGLANDKTVVLLQPLQKELLIIFFRKNVRHFFRSSS